MPQIINTNIASLNAQRNLNASQRDQDTALQRLSSGLRINSAKDDAAGLAISTRFDSQIRGTQVAIRNAGDAISLAQTAEGALDSISSSLQRIRELSVQAANDTNTTVDRQALQEEVDQLVEEISSVAEKTTFNGKKLLDGSFKDSVFQTGANVGDTVKVSIGELSADTLGTANSSGISSRNVSTALSAGSNGDVMVAGDLVINGIAISGSIGSDDTSSADLASSSSIAKAAAINASSDLTGVTAVANENVIEGVSFTTGTVTSETITLNGVSINLTTNSTQSDEQNLSALVEQINAKSGATGVVASFDGNKDTGITLTAEDGRNISINGSTAASFGIAAGGAAGSNANVYVGTFTLISEDGTDFDVSTNTGNIDNAGFEVGTYSGLNSGAVSDNVDVSAALNSGDLVINGVAIGESFAADDTSSTANVENSAIAKAAAINRVSDETGVTATVNETRLNSGAITAATTSATVTVNGVSVQVSFASTDDVSVKLNAMIDAINQKSGQTGVTAEALDADQLTLVAADGRNITLENNSSMLGVATTTFGSSITLSSGDEIELTSQTGNIERAGFRVGTFGGGESGTLLKDIDITTVSGAEDAIKAIDNAIQTVASKRAELGAVQNRFDNTIANLETTNENLSAANSRIKDADFAQETAAMSKSQVLQQAGVSILAQANARPQSVLSLLG